MAYRGAQREAVRQLYTLPRGTIWSLYAVQQLVARDYAQELIRWVVAVIAAEREE